MVTGSQSHQQIDVSSLILCVLLPPAGLSLMPSSGLVELLHRVEAAIRHYSEELVNQLARRDELEFEKEVKNTFITALMEVQNRQKEQRDGSKCRRRDKALSLQGGGTVSTNRGNAASTGRTERTGTMPVKVTGRLISYYCPRLKAVMFSPVSVSSMSHTAVDKV